MKINKNLIIAAFTLFVILLLSLVVKGEKGSPIYFQTEKDAKVGGPYEVSSSRSRYALVEAIAENKTFFFSEKLTKFAGGDLVFRNGKFFTVFTPGVSFVGVPFYLLGKFFGMPQLMTYISTFLFAIINMLLVVIIGRKLGASMYSALIGGVGFLFASNALSYVNTLAQHHLSTMLILLAVINVLSKRTFLNNFLLGGLFGAGVLADIPNAFMMLPLVIYALAKSITIENPGNKITIALKANIIALALGLLPFVGGFMLYNYYTTGSHTTLSQTLGRVDIDKAGKPKERAESQKDKPFEHGQVYDPREQLNGLYILLFSNERGILYYSPIVVIGILGLIAAYKKKENKILVVMLSAVSLICLTSYSMFGDPWGGWAFGPRYLIPAIALLSAGIGIAIQNYKKNLIMIFGFLVIFIYSIFVNSLGAMTTSAIPPKVEAVNLAEPIPYTYTYNLQFVEENRSSSLVYNLFLYSFISFKEYLIVFTVAVSLLVGALYTLKLVYEKA